MMKPFKSMLLGLGLGMLVATPAFAEFGYKIGAATVDDVTTTACTTGKDQTVTAFGNGVDMDQVWALEKEVGSQGSGAFVAVSGFKDVFPTAQGAAAVGGAVQVARYTSPEPACFRLRMTTDGGGTGQIQLVTNRDIPTEFGGNDRTHFRHFDDFQHGTLPVTTTHNGDTPSYIVHIGSGANAVLSVIEGESEGAITFSSGDSGTNDTDLSCGSFGLLTTGALISEGLTAVEFRASMSQIADGRVNIGLQDVISAATEIEAFQANTNVVVEGNAASMANAAVFLFDTDAMDAITDQWMAASLNANAIGNAADEYTIGYSPVATTYALLRIEINASGHAFWYYNGVLVGAEPLAVATTAVLIPGWCAGSADDGTGTVNKIYIDYIDFWAPRAKTAS
jgi:hypothetical protein